MPSNAEQARFNGVSNVLSKYQAAGFNGRGEWTVIVNFLGARDVEQAKQNIAADVRALAPLGRTERWQAAVERWALMIEEARSETLLWALQQGSVFASHAAD